MVSKLPAFKVVLAATLSSNSSSIKLLTKLGFRFREKIELDKEKVDVYTNALPFPA
jgi:hypothetical protein